MLLSLKRIFVFIFFFGLTKIDAYDFFCDESSNSFVLTAILQNYRSKMITEGLPEFNFPPLEPLFIDKINYETRNQHIGVFNLDLKNLTVRELSKFEILGACVFYFSQRIIVNFTVPVISINGHYNLSGALDNFSPGKSIELKGAGPIKFALNNVNFAAHIGIGLGYSGYLKNFNIDFSVESVNSNLENLMGENKHVSHVMNQVVNDVLPDTLRLLKPEMVPSIRDFLFEKIKNILNNLTESKILSAFLKIAL